MGHGTTLCGPPARRGKHADGAQRVLGHESWAAAAGFMRGILRGILMAQLVTNTMVDRYVFVRIAGGQPMGVWTSGERALGRRLFHV